VSKDVNKETQKNKETHQLMLNEKLSPSRMATALTPALHSG